MKKTILALLLVLALCLPCFVGCDTGTNNDEKTSDTMSSTETDNTEFPDASEGLEYKSKTNNTCEVSGIGTCTDSEIVIPSISPDGDSVTSIGYEAFYDCTSLTSVVIPDSVTNIGISAFSGCSSLASVVIPDSVTNIGNFAFFECSSLTSVAIPDSVTSIGSMAFYNCAVLRDVVVPSSVISIGDWVFKGCNNLEYNVFDNAYYLGNDANPYIILIKSRDFAISTCEINAATKFISEYAFDNCIELTSIAIPNRVVSIGSCAFRGCTNLKNVSLSSALKMINSGTFLSCENLVTINIPHGIEIIESSAFKGCSALASLTIPDSITSIGLTAFEGTSIRFSEYSNAYYLESGTNPYFALIDTKNTEFSVCQINDNTKIIADYAFSGCDEIIEVTVPNSVKHIGDGAFMNCKRLESASIGQGVREIGISAFEGCTKLTSVTFKKTEGWRIMVTVKNGTFQASISELSDASIAATHLKEKHYAVWYCD